MKQTSTFALLSAAALAAALLAAAAARAFTYQSAAPGDRGANLNYTDPDQNLAPKSDGSSRFDNGSTGSNQSGFTMQFNQGGERSFDQRYNANNMFDPFAREGR